MDWVNDSEFSFLKRKFSMLHMFSRRIMSNLAQNEPLINNFGKLASLPNLLCTFKQNFPSLNSVPTKASVGINLIVP